jgi:hypothetical protein
MMSASSEDGELGDILDYLRRPAAVSLGRLQTEAKGSIAGSQSIGDWINDRKNRRAIPGRLERCGYVAVRNPDAADGLWVIGGRRQAVYGNSTLISPISLTHTAAATAPIE